jgi:hypothetical protein
MSFTSKGLNEILVAGAQEKMFKIDLEKGAVIDIVCTLVPVRYSFAD